MSRPLSHSGLQWIRGSEAIDTIEGLTSFKLYALVVGGLVPHDERLKPLLPLNVQKVVMERAMWLSWLLVYGNDGLKEASRADNTILTARQKLPTRVSTKLNELVESCGYALSGGDPPVLVFKRGGRIPGCQEQERSWTPEDHGRHALDQVESMTRNLSEYGANPWATVQLDLHQEEVESHRLLNAYYEYADIMERLNKGCETTTVAGIETTPEPHSETTDSLKFDPRSLIREARSEIETFYSALRDGLKKSRNDWNTPSKVKAEALYQLEIGRYEFITESALKIDWVMTLGTERRAFRRRVLQKILQDRGYGDFSGNKIDKLARSR